MIRILTPTVGFFHSTAIEQDWPSKTPYVLGDMGITTPILALVASKDIHRNGFVRRPVAAATLAACIANGALYGMGRMIGHIVN